MCILQAAVSEGLAQCLASNEPSVFLAKRVFEGILPRYPHGGCWGQFLPQGLPIGATSEALYHPGHTRAGSRGL